jgi:hypothetical protein
MCIGLVWGQGAQVALAEGDNLMGGEGAGSWAGKDIGTAPGVVVGVDQREVGAVGPDGSPGEAVRGQHGVQLGSTGDPVIVTGDQDSVGEVDCDVGEYAEGQGAALGMGDDDRTVVEEGQVRGEEFE